MVVVRRVKAVNFRRLNLKEPLELGRGVVFIKGRNEAGKSTLVETVLFGIYGDYRIVGSLRGNPQAGYSDVVNHHARKAMVEVEFEVDGRIYRVERMLEKTRDSVSQSEARLVELTGKNERLVASTVSGVNDQVAKLLRVSWREMLTTNVVAQKDLERIIRMKGDDRERVINLMMGLEAYNRATDRIEEERRGLQNKFEELKARTEEVNRTITLLEEQKRNIAAWLEKLASVKRELPTYIEREKMFRKAVEFLEELSSVFKQKVDFQRDLNSVEKRLVELQEEWDEGFKEKSRLETEIRSLKTKSSGYSNLAARVLQLEKERSSLVESIEKLKTPLWAKTGSLILVITGLLLTLITPLFLLVTVAGVGLWLGGVEAKNRRSVKLYRARSQLEEELAKLKSSLEALKRDEEDIRRFEEDVQRVSTKIEKLEKQRNQLNTQAEKIRESFERFSLPSVPEETVELFKGVDLNSYETIEKIRSDYAGELSQASEKRIGAETSVKELQERIGEAENQIAQLDVFRKEFEEMTQRLKALGLEIETRKKSVELMQEVSRRMRETFAPSVEDYMSETISHFTEGRYKAVRLQPSTYDVEVYDAEAGSWLRRDIYSGGTNDQFLLALRIAFTLSLLPSAKGVYPRFLILDEPLGSSDTERRSRIVEFLSGELTRFFDQLFIITHVEVEEPSGSRVIMLDDGRVSRVYMVGGDEGMEEDTGPSSP